MVVDPRHDHSFRIPRPDLSVMLGTPNACNDCHKDKPAKWSAGAIEKWFGPTRKGFQNFAPALAAARTEHLDAPQLLRRIAADAEQPAIARATAMAELAPFLTLAVSVELQRGLDDPDPLVRLAALQGLSGLPPEQRWQMMGAMLQDPVRAVRIEAASLLAGIPAGQPDDRQQKSLDSAISEYVSSQRLNAERPESQLNLGLLYVRMGESDKAEAAYRAAIRLDTRFVPAYVNLADLYRSSGRDADGEGILRDAARRMPDEASIPHALGLLLVRDRRLAEAVNEFRRSTRMAPDNARYAYVSAIALDSVGRRADAVRALEANLRRHPADRDTITALFSFKQESGDHQAALAYARQLQMIDPENPELARLIATMESRK